MTNDVHPAPPPTRMRRYPLLGGAAAWYVPLLAVMLATGAVAFEAFEVAIGAAAFGWAVHRLTRSVVVGISPTGVTRGLLSLGSFRARTIVIPWGAIVEVHTAWCRPGDAFGLETAVRDHEGRTIGLSTAMGLTAYWACLAEIVRRAPGAARSGITDAVVADGPPARHHVVSAIGTAAALALVLAAVVTTICWRRGETAWRGTSRRSAPRASSRCTPVPAADRRRMPSASEIGAAHPATIVGSVEGPDRTQANGAAGGIAGRSSSARQGPRIVIAMTAHLTAARPAVPLGG
jgi:hypothetical protein